MVGHAASDGEHRIHHGAQLARRLDPSGYPIWLDAERVVNVAQRRPREPRTGLGRTRIRRQPVDVGEGESCIFDRGQARVRGELQGVSAQPPTDLGLADPTDDDLVG
ncbi:hypothetical protein [Mycolicibacterium elephantis]|uniref:hypothetical protein n=1 Tax=Mycolicibacterium elephantis TaxID=81858 RepID=UPI003A86BE2C